MKEFCFDFDPLECQKCRGKCCRGESGYIFASLKELENIADFLGIAFEDFLLGYVKKVGYKFSLIEKKLEGEYACVFFEDGKCSIYEARPKQCRDFPFWETYKEEKNLPQLFIECKGAKRRKN